ncbi:ATP-binding protein [Rheinheimera sp. F8]|uniref:AAA family ATPase n=1 Tax=Rheinheimera sp. F8 TaxID=1763998 RepID=UPI000744BDA7|nr:ATP-binding protein [Rheinheimera sp. F8]ALZ75386.1 hypothetical protein ATY27_06210 [Rheinheimera sp. F8]ALZ75800.1 hypothetical protein ATY27_08495 [Rheinheimera sp. F8]
MVKKQRTGFEFLACRYAIGVLQSGDFTELDECIHRASLARLSGISALRYSKLSFEECVAKLAIADKSVKSTQLIEHNANFLIECLSLPANALELVTFILVLNAHAPLRHMLSAVEANDLHDQLEISLCEQLAIDVDQAREVVKTLFGFGLLKDMNLMHPSDLEIPEHLRMQLRKTKISSKEELLSAVLIESDAAAFNINEFPHINSNLVCNYLENAVLAELTGINVLFYGPPGVGKSEFARALSDHLSRYLFEVRAVSIKDGQFTDDERAPKIDKQRVSYLQFINQMLNANNQSMLLIDECESLFISADLQYSKEQLHRLLEKNNVPSIWITNHVECIEESFLRRFKLVLEFPQPTRQMVQSLATEAFAGLKVSNKFVQQLVPTANLSHALIANAAHVAKTIGSKGKEAEQIIMDVVESSLRAADLWNDEPSYQQALDFDITLLNIKQAAAELEQIRYAIERNEPIRVLLSGPAGTGKTAFAHYLAQQCQRDINRVKCSDVLDKYVGESEKNVARLFQTAHRDKQILLLDEVDSLLSSRERLHNQYEIQLVNELLTQMECFTQPLFAATNFDSLLDKAVLRRFDFKLDCDYLKTHQVQQLYKQLLAVKTLTATEQSYLEQLRNLTVGDFAILARRIKFLPAQNHRSSALQLLNEENKRKAIKPQIGFI